jgi:hypothetical protein
MINLIGTVFILISIYCGYKEVNYIIYILSSSTISTILYYLSKIDVFIHDIQSRTIFRSIIGVLLSQLAIWSIFYGVGRILSIF